jgi:cold shock CspA family protein
MPDTIYKGTVTFVNHEKQYAAIEYTHNSKIKTVNYKTNADKKAHQFRTGDVVNFEIKTSDRGDKMVAFNVKFLYNTALELLINKSSVENRFSGYLKMVDDELYVKEWDSYLFFPLKISNWEKPPAASAFNEAISFKLINLDKPNSIAAELFSHDFIPEYKEALQHFKNKKEIEATVAKVSPFAAYLNLFGEKVQAKIKLPAAGLENVKEGDKIKVLISFLSNTRIAIERV